MRYLRYVWVMLLVVIVHRGYGMGDPDSLRVAKLVKDSVFTITPGLSSLYEPADVLEEGIIQSHFSDSTPFWLSKSHAARETVHKTQNFIKNLDKLTEFNLPVGIGNYVDGINYDVVIYAIRLKPTHAELDVFLEFDVPSNGQTLSFMARGIKYTKKGGIIGDARLELLTDYAINLGGNKSQIILKANETYATIDCDGFKELGVGADVKFSRDLIVPENPDGSIAPGNVIASFKTVIGGWNDLIVQLTIPTFQMKGLTGVSFAVQDAVFDFSDLRNSPSVIFPEGYQSTLMLPDNANLWQGFYLRDLTIKLPQQFKQRGTTSRTTFNASNVIIDNMGLTGKFSATDLITLQQGDMSGWDFSLTELHVEIQTNQLVEAGFSGEIVIPISKEDTPFEYSAIINTEGNYLFHVSPATDLEFDVFKAGHVTIREASYLEIRVEDDKFLPKANLHGSMSITASLSEGGKGVSLANIDFENLEIQTVKPYIQVGNVGFGSEALDQAMAGFPISIQDVGMRSIGDNDVALDFKLKLNLVKESSGAFAADAGLSIIGTMRQEAGRQKFKYKDIQVHEIGVDIDGGAFKIKGRLIFYRNDKTYGDGFNGMVDAQFKPGIKVRAGAIFGSVGGDRYWYADALVSFERGIPIFTGVAVYGFGGGIFYGMKLDKYGEGSELGRTSSGITYVPDSRSGLGLKAMITMGSYPSPQAFNAEVFFEISFFKGGGVRYIAFGGSGTLITPGLDTKIEKLAKNAEKMVSVVAESDAPEGNMKGGNTHSLDAIFGPASEIKAALAARVFIEYDFENTTLHGNFEVFINVAGGIIRGIGDNNRAGWAVLHFAPHEWYIYVGTPDDRVGVSIGIASIRAEATSYFMVGTKILGSPPPPDNVVRILGGGDYDYMKNLNEIGTGAGFAFGASFDVSTGDLSFLIFYARFDAGAGFDIMLKDYGDARCAGSNDRLGINGWYANGQAYAYFEGSIGIKIKVFGFKKKIKILEIGAAALLQAKLPNPFWMRGTVGGYFSVLGGVVKGNCKFEVTLGKECVMQRSESAILEGIEVIAQLTPGRDETLVNVFTTPQAVFNIAVEKEFEMLDEAEGNRKRKFKIKLDHFKVISEDGREMPGVTQWNDNNDVLAFNGHEILPPEERVSLHAQVSFEEYRNGSWVPVLSEGKPYRETMEHTFTTDKAPPYIPLSNVEYSYPIIGQVNFLKDESRIGYIKLKQSQQYLFEPGPEWRQEGRFLGATGDVSLFEIKYTYSNNMIDYSIPTTMRTDQLYSIELVNVPKNAGGAVDRNVSESTASINVEGQNLDSEIVSKEAEGSIAEYEEKTIYSAQFRSSTYSTLDQKINAFQFGAGWVWQLDLGAYELNSTMSGVEFFDYFDLGNSNESNENLIRFEADLSGNDWYNNLVYPITYEGYPVMESAIVKNRNVEILGLPPVRAIFMRQRGDGPILNESNATYVKSLLPPLSSIVYNLSPVMKKDFEEIQRKCASLSLTQSNDRIHRILYSTFPTVRTGTYKIKIQYYLPGINKVTSERNVSISYNREGN